MGDQAEKARGEEAHGGGFMEPSSPRADTHEPISMLPCPVLPGKAKDTHAHDQALIVGARHRARWGPPARLGIT